MELLTSAGLQSIPSTLDVLVGNLNGTKAEFS